MWQRKMYALQWRMNHYNEHKTLNADIREETSNQRRNKNNKSNANSRQSSVALTQCRSHTGSRLFMRHGQLYNAQDRQQLFTDGA